MKRRKKQTHIYFALQRAWEVSPTLHGLFSKPVLAGDCDFRMCHISSGSLHPPQEKSPNDKMHSFSYNPHLSLELFIFQFFSHFPSFCLKTFSLYTSSHAGSNLVSPLIFFPCPALEVLMCEVTPKQELPGLTVSELSASYFLWGLRLLSLDPEPFRSHSLTQTETH